MSIWHLRIVQGCFSISTGHHDPPKSMVPTPLWIRKMAYCFVTWCGWFNLWPSWVSVKWNLMRTRDGRKPEVSTPTVCRWFSWLGRTCIWILPATPLLATQQTHFYRQLPCMRRLPCLVNWWRWLWISCSSSCRAAVLGRTSWKLWGDGISGIHNDWEPEKTKFGVQSCLDWYGCLVGLAGCCSKVVKLY